MASITQKTDPVTLLYDLKREADSERNRHHTQWRENKNLYAGNQWGDSDLDSARNRVADIPGQNKQTINLIRNAVNGMVSAMTETRPQTNITPMETDVPGMYYLKVDPGRKLTLKLKQLEEAVKAEDQAIELAKLLKEAGEDVEIPEKTIQVPQDVDDVANGFKERHFTGQTPLLPEQFDVLRENIDPITQTPFLVEDDAFLINDIAVADTIQRVLDGVWNRFNWDDKRQDNQLEALVLGHRDVIVQFDDSIDEVVIDVLLERDSWIDPNPKVKDIPQAHNYVIGEVLDPDEAIRMNPEHEEAILKNLEDPSSATGGNGEQLSDRYTDIDWERDMAIIYTCWIRDQNMDSIRKHDKFGRIVSSKIKDPETGKAVKVFGLREIRVIGSTLLYDGPSRYDDIPAVRFKFITIIDSSYSIGFPELLRDLQKTFNTTISNLADHTKYLPKPLIWGDSQVITECFEDEGGVFNNPLNVIKVPQHLFDKETARDPVNVLNTPSLNPSYIAFLQLIRDIFNDMSNQGDVIRGIASSKAESGKAIDALQGAANRILTLASRWFDRAITRLNRLTYEYMVKFASIEKWLLYTDKYPKHVLQHVINRARVAEFNVRVESAGTRSQKRAERQQKAVLMRERGLMSLQTALEEMEVDNPKEESKRIISEQVAAAQAQSQATAQENQAEVQGKIAIEQVKGDEKLKQIKLEKEMEGVVKLEIERIKLQNSKEEKSKSDKAA
ncbi:MAG: hypothetical protein ACR2MX_08375 [Cyclobacteriaceae bacterium]